MEIGKTYSGFTVTACQEVPDLEARLYQMEHAKSGARLVWLDRKDENKTFMIAFRTIPHDDTGVFHILEHSVLCGSDKYPVKEPFVELLKNSMNTFLNAFTYPDKTCYPVSSRNGKDFMNLVRVYMDAVTHPLIYSKPEIFRQEGWHYEMPKDGGQPAYKGVVFNEMKGAFSSPDAVMAFEILRGLFPDTCYGCESGGYPKSIPELTYEQFLDAHRTFYHPSNSYICLDGSMDIEAVLAMLDGDYLNAFDRQERQPEFTFQAPVKPDTVRAYYEVSPNEPKEKRARTGWGWVLGDYTAWEDLMAMEAIADAICGSNQAPLKKKILSSGLGEDVSLYVMGELLQPYISLEVRNMDENRLGEVESAVREELERLVREGLDHAQLAATLANMEFKLRERDYGFMPQGLSIILNMLESWLYGGDPAAHLKVGELFASLNRKLEEGYFESLLERALLSNSHSCEVLLLPSATLGEEDRAEEARRLREAAASWTPEERAELEAQQAALDAWQGSQDTPEALATLPSLRLSDIPAKPQDIPTEAGSLGGAPLLRHAIPAGGVGYVNLYFDVSGLTAEELPQATLLCCLLGSLDTAAHTSLELQRLRRLLLGSLRCSMEPCGRLNDPASCRTYLCVSFSALEGKLEEAAALVSEIITSTRFDDSQKILELLRQNCHNMEMAVTESGNRYAAVRIAAGISVEGAIREYAGGISFCQWLKALEKDFDSRCQSLIAALQSLSGRIFTTGLLTASVTGSTEACEKALEKSLRLPVTPRETPECAIRPWAPRKEGVIIPADVSYAALGGSLLELGVPYSGRLRVAGRLIELTYLWNVIRVQGGAYGTGLNLSDNGSACFTSYRDPSAARSLGRYREADGFLKEFCGGHPDLTGLIIGAASVADPLMLPGRKGKTADLFHLKGMTYADRCRQWEEILSTTPEAVSAMADAVGRLAETGGVCVVGSKKLVEACGELDSVFTL